MQGQRWYISHAETLVQNVLGLLISFLVLQMFGMGVVESLHLQLVLFFTSYARSYLVRRYFNRL